MDVTYGHLIAFTLGVGTWLPFTLWEGRRVMDHQHDTPESEVTASGRPKPRRMTIILTALLVTSLFLIAFGVQQHGYQQERDKRDACYETWGQGLVDTVQTRTGASNKVSEAQDARDTAVDDVLLVVIGLRATPPQAVDADLDPVLAAFASARSQLTAAQASLTTTRKRNPYPVLDCR